MSSTQELNNFSNNILNKIKENLNQLVEKDRESIDQLDYTNLIENEDLLKRYIRRKRGHVGQSANFIFEVLQWRKKIKIFTYNEQSFPKEFYELGGLYLCGKDVDGNYVLHIRTRLYQKVSHIFELLKKFTIFMMYKADQMAAKENVGWILFFDCTEAGLLNADIEMANFVVSTIRQYFPSGQRYALVHNCPWFLNALKNIIFKMLPANVKKSVRFSNEKTLHEFIDKQNLPGYLGGCGEYAEIYRFIPNNLNSISEVLNLNEEGNKKVKKYYEKLSTIIENKSIETLVLD